MTDSPWNIPPIENTGMLGIRILYFRIEFIFVCGFVSDWRVDTFLPVEGKSHRAQLTSMNPRRWNLAWDGTSGGGGVFVNERGAITNVNPAHGNKGMIHPHVRNMIF